MLKCGPFELSLAQPLVMGIVNLTPDSFSGDGVTGDVSRAIDHAMAQIAAGADLLDIGAESSRPGAEPTPLAEELARLLPVLDALQGCGVPLSVDTYKPQVMREAIRSGAAMINDIYGFRLPGAIDTVTSADCGLCVMHMQGEPLSMQAAPEYADVVGEVADFLASRLAALCDAGVAPERLCVDPGFGFGKTLADNLALFNALPRFAAIGQGVLVGVSRKSMLGAITGRPVGERVNASVAAALLAAERGAAILRVHDVAATRDALAVLAALRDNAG
jgi:dihydropteroate synthase